MLKYRILTAAVLIPLVLAVLFFAPPLVFGGLLVLIVALSAWEWTRLVGYSHQLPRILYTVIIVLGVILSAWLPAVFTLGLGFLVLLWCTIAVISYQKYGHAGGLEFEPLRIVLGICILIPFWVACMMLQTSPRLGPLWLLMALLVIWAADTGAYLAGRLWGKHKWVPKVSPNKTWEGVAGGLILGLFVAFVMTSFLPVNSTQQIWICLLAFFAILFSMLGDLLVSLLKRLMGLKDTGTLLPGHGGILDRIDSVTAGIIVFALGLTLLV